MKKVSLLFCLMLQVSTSMANLIDIEQARGIAVELAFTLNQQH
jgi:hypothetical protein